MCTKHKPQCQRGLCLPAKMGLNIRTIIAKIPSVTIPEVIAEVKAVCAAEVADLSAPDDETVDLDLAAATLQH